MRFPRLVLPVLSAAAAIAIAPSAAAAPGYQPCPSPHGQLIEVGGAATCADAALVVDGYDRDGEKVQFIGAYSCYTAPADVRPIMLICADGDNEVVLSST